MTLENKSGNTIIYAHLSEEEIKALCRAADKYDHG